MSKADELRKRLDVLPDEWREHVRELRQENARRRVRVTELEAALAKAEREIRGLKAAAEKEPRCYVCGCAVDLYFGPDPYSSEVNNDETPVWLCGACTSDRAGEI